MAKSGISLSPLLPIFVLALLSACGSGSKKPLRGAQRPPPPKAAAPDRFNSNTPEYRQCIGKLAALGARYTPLPDKNTGSCTIYGAVRLDDIGVPTSNLGPMTCPLAEKFAAWARYGVAPAARLILGSELVKIESMGTYSCRTIAGSGRLSEHAHSNAVDIGAFVLADGRRISIRNDWNGSKENQEFLRRIRESACKRFRTVLSPDYNAAHHDHLHFDLGGKGTYCR